MSNLVPEPRTDRTGRTQTRWIKPAPTGSGTPRIPDPVPAVPQPAEGGADPSETLRALVGASPALEVLEADPRLADDIIAAVREADGDERVLTALQSDIRSMRVPEPNLGPKLRFALVEALYGKHIPSNPLGVPLRFREARESGMFWLAEERLKGRPETREAVHLAVAMGFMAAACQIIDMNTPRVRALSTTFYYLDDNPELVGVFDEYRDRAHELAEFVIEHGTDAGPARAHMRGESDTALSDGML